MAAVNVTFTNFARKSFSVWVSEQKTSACLHIECVWWSGVSEIWHKFNWMGRWKRQRRWYQCHLSCQMSVPTFTVFLRPQSIYSFFLYFFLLRLPLTSRPLSSSFLQVLSIFRRRTNNKNLDQIDNGCVCEYICCVNRCRQRRLLKAAAVATFRIAIATLRVLMDISIQLIGELFAENENLVYSTRSKKMRWSVWESMWCGLRIQEYTTKLNWITNSSFIRTSKMEWK